MSNCHEVRSTILQLVSSLISCDPQEKEDIEFAKKWIASGAEIFRIAKPDQPNIHLVSYFILIDQHECLLVDHKKACLWLPPGGHVEVNEHPTETVKREAKEELGIEAEFLFDSPLFLTVTNTVGNVACHTDVSLWYVLKGKKGDHLKFDEEEFHQIRWFTWEEIPFERADPKMRRFMHKTLNTMANNFS